MPGPTLTPLASDRTLPDRADVVVIGGGIIGASTALELVERGLSVLLCEKGEIAGEQSSRNWGWVRLACRDPREIPLMLEAIRLWEGLDRRLERKTGYTQSGILFAAAHDRELASYARWIEHLGPYQAEARILTASQLATRMPGHRMALKGALWTPKDGRAEPQWAAPAIAEAARERGASMVTQCAVRGLDLAAGRIAGVLTERGRVRCDAVVLAGGAWSRLFASRADVALPQLKVMNTVMRTTPVDGPEAAIWADNFSLRKRADGGYTVASGQENIVDLVPDSLRLARAFLPALRADWRSLRFRISGRWAQEWREETGWTSGGVTPFERCRVLDPTPSDRILRRSWRAARQAFPMLQGADVIQSWAGMIDVTPDAIPVISQVEAVPGFHIATGFSGHGFGIGPGAGRLMADLVVGAPPCVDPHDFRLSRFSDGSGIHMMAEF